MNQIPPLKKTLIRVWSNLQLRSLSWKTMKSY